MIDETLLSVLACPRCDDRPPLRQEGDLLVCTKCEHAYPIEEGIPNLLPDAALPPSRWKQEETGKSDGRES
ncbi:MAG: Trm112 family protein [Armatimonadetes bacterium]|nr:MAG: Trm112 family protein [Armatimonadota bacterium]GIV02520.1 MAG: hypothetical protein KatS3mg015_1350 [Fimbriimonadales bacterium]